MAAIRKGERLHVRNPDAIRPWQFVLEPLSGYLMLAEKLWDEPTRYAQGWNFGPAPGDVRPVRWIVEKLNDYCTEGVRWEMDTDPQPHEAHVLVLDSAQARMILGWKPRWTIEEALRAVVNWYQAYWNGQPLREVAMRQIDSYESLAAVS